MQEKIESRNTYNEISWEAFPRPARRIIKEMLEDITSEIDLDPEAVESLRDDVFACVRNVSWGSRFRSANSVGKAILEAADERYDPESGNLDATGIQLSLIGNALLRIS